MLEVCTVEHVVGAQHHRGGHVDAGGAGENVLRRKSGEQRLETLP